MSDDQHLPVLKIPCRVFRNPTYFTKYLAEKEEQEENSIREKVQTPKPKKVKLPPICGKGVKSRDFEARSNKLRYDTAYGNAYIIKKLIDKELHISDIANVYAKMIPKPPSPNLQYDLYNYKPKIKREFPLWESRKGIKYYKGNIDKRIVEAKQRINKSWKKEFREYFRKAKITENILLKKAESMNKGLKAYLKTVDKEREKYENDENVIKLRKCNAVENTKPKVKKTKKKKVTLPSESDLGSCQSLYSNESD